MSSLRFAVILVMAGCAGSSRVAAPPTPVVAPPSKTAENSAGKPAEMLRHELIALAIRDAVIDGDLPAVRRHAFILAGQAVFETRTPEYDERAIRLGNAASAVAAAKDIHQAALRVGEMTNTCAECHARLGGPTWLDMSSVPPPPTDFRSRMVRHDWAMHALWVGMVGNAEPPWNAGAAVLADPAIGSELARGKPSTVDALATSVHDLGIRAGKATDSHVRAVIYGELLGTCAACHTLPPPERGR